MEWQFHIPLRRLAFWKSVAPLTAFLSDQLLSAHDRKNLKYAIVERALHQYVTAGWQVEILPWVVGIRGLIEEKSIHAAVEYLDISRSEWAAAVACIVVASVRLPSCTG